MVMKKARKIIMAWFHTISSTLPQLVQVTLSLQR
jgi:hypothetical protein